MPAVKKSTRRSKAPAAASSHATQAKGSPSRRRPRQERSQRRFESILMVAAESFARQGFAATTMEGIAAAAQTSIGSVYQFFPNKRAVFREVALRCMELTRQSHPTLVGPDPSNQPWNVVLERYIDGYRQMFEDNVMMQAMWRNVELYGEYAEADEAMLREMVGVTAMIVASWAPTLAPPRHQVVSIMIVNTIATTMLVITREPEHADALVEETKRMLVRYLTLYLGEPTPR